FVGLAKGFYDEQGIDLDVQIFPTALDMIPLLATGRLDAMHGGSYPGIFNAVAGGVDLKIVSNVSVFRQPGPGLKNSQWLVVRKDLADQIRSVADLKGRKVAIHSIGSTAEQLLEKTLEYHRMSLSDVQIEAVP